MKEVLSENFTSLNITVHRGIHRVLQVRQGRASIPAKGVERASLTGQVIESILKERDVSGEGEKISKIHIKWE